MLTRLGEPRHRGIDLIAAEDDENQTLGGKLAYTAADKDLEDEDVVIYACRRSAWQIAGAGRTDDEGRFVLTLRGAARLPVGMTDLYAFVPGDGSGVRFLGYVAARGDSVIITDVDGTITASESAVYNTVLWGTDIAHQPGAPQAFAASSKAVVYVTARGDQLTEVTRHWLAAHGFPKGPLRLAPSLVTLPGSRTTAFKASVVRELGVPVAAGVGNRASDVTAYQRAGVTADRIFVILPEFTRELRPQLAAGAAVAIDELRDLQRQLR